MTREQLIENLEKAALAERANAHKSLGKAEGFEAAREALISVVEPVVEADEAEAADKIAALREELNTGSTDGK